MVLGLLAVIIRNPEMIHNLEHDGFDDNSVDMEAPILPTPLSKIDPPYAYRDHSLNYRTSFYIVHLMGFVGKISITFCFVVSDNIDMGGLVCVCMIGITLLLIYGAVKGKPSHILPYFCVQLFDFAITT